MTQIGRAQISDVSSAANISFVEWGAVWAGGALAAAISFVLLAFGTAIGLSFVSPWSDAWASTKLIASMAIFWTMAQQIGSAMVGGYVAGRMRSRWGEASDDEVEFRDGLHGGLVWAVGVIITGTLLLTAAGLVAKGGAELAGRTAVIATPLDNTVDRLLRPVGPAVKSTVAAGATSSPPALSPSFGEIRAGVVRTFANGLAHGSLDDQDRAYLATTVGEQTGLAQTDAEKRVNDVFAEADAAAKDAANKVRRASILTGFVSAASLLVALGAAWWAGQRGGHHRDNSIPARFVTSNPRRVA